MGRNDIITEHLREKWWRIVKKREVEDERGGEGEQKKEITIPFSIGKHDDKEKKLEEKKQHLNFKESDIHVVKHYFC